MHQRTICKKNHLNDNSDGFQNRISQLLNHTTFYLNQLLLAPRKFGIAHLVKNHFSKKHKIKKLSDEPFVKFPWASKARSYKGWEKTD